MSKKVGFSLSGITSIILGVVCFFLDVGRYADFESYGGDAYTGIQHAAAQTANNIQYLAVIVKFGFGFILIVAGLVLIAVAVSLKNNEKQQAVAIGTVSLSHEQPISNEPVAESFIDSAAEMKRYKQLLDSGAISQEEFEEKKKKLLDL